MLFRPSGVRHALRAAVPRRATGVATRRARPVATRPVRRLCASAASVGSTPAVEPPTGRQLLLHARLAAVPMIGFGFMDNLIMIQAGEYIDSTFGVALGLSTLTAAACGNIVSDTSGTLFGGIVDAAVASLRLERPGLTETQARLRRTKFAGTGGAMAGVILGCILGSSCILLMDVDRAERLKRAKQLETISRAVLSRGHELLGAERCTLYLYDAERSELWTQTMTGADPFTFALPIEKRAIACHVGRSREMVNIADAGASPHFSGGAGAHRAGSVGSSASSGGARVQDAGSSFVTREVLCSPIVDEESGQLLGVIQALNKVQPQSSGAGREGFSREDEKLIIMLSQHIAIFLGNFGSSEATRQPHALC